MEKAREFQKNIYFCFIDYAKAFDCVDHKKLWKILKEMGIPDYLTCLLRNLYTGQKATFRTGHGTPDWFQIGKGVHQGCILSPCLFNLYAEYIMRSTWCWFVNKRIVLWETWKLCIILRTLTHECHNLWLIVRFTSNKLWLDWVKTNILSKWLSMTVSGWVVKEHFIFNRKRTNRLLRTFSRAAWRNWVGHKTLITERASLCIILICL